MQWLTAGLKNAGAFSTTHCPCFVRVSATPNMFSLPGRRLDDRWLLLLGGFQVGLRFFHCVPQIIFGHDVIPVEYRPGAVAADAHSSFFADSGAHHVSHRGSSQVVKDAAH